MKTKFARYNIVSEQYITFDQKKRYIYIWRGINRILQLIEHESAG